MLEAVKDTIKRVLNTLPYIKHLHQEVDGFKRFSFYPLGHYYSPIVSTDEVIKNEKDIWKGIGDCHINGINLNVAEQLRLIEEFRKFYPDLPFEDSKKRGLRYYYNNDFYTYGEAVLLYSMIRHLKPKRIIEVGSGYSSALMLDTKQLFEPAVELIFIEPHPERLFSLLKNDRITKATIIKKEVQKVAASFFDQLEENDIFFIDSSHVSKTGSDVNYILFDILPRLKSGVFIHFHDIYYPFEYPKKWVLQGRNWNESYILRAYLSYNDSFTIRLFADFLNVHHKEVFAELPLCYKNPGSCLWLQKNEQSK